MDNQTPIPEKPKDYTATAVSSDSLFVTDIFHGEHVVRGGEDGQVHVATFSNKVTAELFISFCMEHKNKAPWVFGVRP